MARGSPGAFGGTAINNPWIWGGFCLVFLVGLGDWRRPFSLRNLDLLFLLSPTASLWFFNHGNVFASVPLFYPLLVWVVLRATWIGVRNRGTPGAPRWPVWVLLGATIFLAGFRVGLNIERSNVIDVGYSGVIGAERIVHGEAPWGNFPVEKTAPNGESLKACGTADSSGEIREWIQTNGRCESANPEGDTYGPVAYESYIPGYLVLGWSGKWDSLPAAHFTAIAFDLLTMLGLFLVGLRLGGQRLGAVFAFAWAAYPFTQYVSNSNTNDAIMPCFLVWGFWLASRPVARGSLAGLSGWTKFASLLIAPLWLTYPGRKPSKGFLWGFAVATLAAFSVFLLEPNAFHEAHVFWTRTVGFQIGRAAPWSLWDWGQYHARGLPDLHLVQRVLQVALARRCRRGRFLPAPQVTAAARRAHRGAPRRLRARPDVLALHLHPVVLSVRRDRATGAGGATAAPGHPAAGGTVAATRRRDVRRPRDRRSAPEAPSTERRFRRRSASSGSALARSSRRGATRGRGRARSPRRAPRRCT